MPKPRRRPSLYRAAAAAIGVERKFGVGQVAPFGRGPPRAVAAGFLVAGEEDDDVAGRLEPGRLELQQREQDAGQRRLLVAGRRGRENSRPPRGTRTGRASSRRAWPRPRPCAPSAGSASCRRACRRPAGDQRLRLVAGMVLDDRCRSSPALREFGRRAVPPCFGISACGRATVGISTICLEQRARSACRGRASRCWATAAARDAATGRRAASSERIEIPPDLKRDARPLAAPRQSSCRPWPSPR